MKPHPRALLQHPARQVTVVLESLLHTLELWNTYLAPLTADLAATSVQFYEAAASGRLEQLLQARVEAAVREQLEQSSREVQLCL